MNYLVYTNTIYLVVRMYRVYAYGGNINACTNNRNRAAVCCLRRCCLQRVICWCTKLVVQLTFVVTFLSTSAHILK